MSWAVLGASLAGTSHLARGTPCQDAHRHAALGGAGEWLVVAVADGAGSAPHAEVGAELACGELVRLVEEAGANSLAARGDVLTLFDAVRDALCRRSDELGVAPRELACTALLVVAGPDSTLVAQVGDGAVVLGDGAGNWRVAFWPEPAEYANATDFLTGDDYAERLQVELNAGRVGEVAVLSDGLQRLALDFLARCPHPAFFQPLFEQLRQAVDPTELAEPFRTLLESPRFNDRTDDDKTLVVAVRRSP